MARMIESEREFDSLMHEIDQKMQVDGVPIHLRELTAMSEVAKFLDVEFIISPLKSKPTPGVYSGADLPAHISVWIRNRYGDRLNFDFTNGYAVLLIRGDPWLLRFPLLYGEVTLVCERDLSKKYPSFVVTRPGDPPKKPTVSILQCVKDLPQGLVSSLSDRELRDILKFFLSGHEFLNALNSFCRDRPLAMSALLDLNASARYCVSGPTEYGQSRWSSLQAAEKLFKFYIEYKGHPFPKTHQLSELAPKAAALGLSVIDAKVLDAIRCDAGVRYEQRRHAVNDVVAAHHGALAIGSAVVAALFPGT
jgi:hypothetical protein